MIRVYEATEKLFHNNGLKVLKPQKCYVYIEDNGDYYVEMENPIEDLQFLKQDYIVLIDTRYGKQPFRLANPRVRNNIVYSKGLHVFYDSKNYAIFNGRVEERDLNYTLDYINTHCDDITPFTTISDVTTIASTQFTRKSLLDAVYQCIEKWGGHLERNAFQIGIRNIIGSDKQIVLAMNKNIVALEKAENWDFVVTKLMPVGFDGITLPEKYILSEVKYDIPYTRIVTFEQDIDQEAYKDENGNTDEVAYKEALINDLRLQAIRYIELNQYMRINYTVNANVFDNVIELGDIVQVKHELYDIDILTNVISLTYDAILDKYVTVQFGNFRQELKNLQKMITAETQKQVKLSSDSTTAFLEQELQNATSQIINYLSNSFAVYESNQTLYVDRLPKEEAINVLRINDRGIGFSQNGIYGPFNSAWTIDGTLDMQVINVINLTASMIRGGTLVLGGTSLGDGNIEIKDLSNRTIGTINKNGFTMFSIDGGKVVIDTTGLNGNDKNGNSTFYAIGDEFYTKKLTAENEFNLGETTRFVDVNDQENVGFGVVALV